MYLHELPPPPHPIDYASALIPTSSSPVNPAHLSRATQRREALRTVLANAFSGSSGAAAEIKAIQAIDEYLPSLVAIVHACRTDEVVWRGTQTRAPFVWYPLLAPSPSSSDSKARSLGIGSSSSKGGTGSAIASHSAFFELENILILYSLCLSNLAVLQSISVGNYEFSRTLSETERKEKESVLKRGVQWGKKAVNVIQWLLEQSDSAGAGSGSSGGCDGTGANEQAGYQMEEWHEQRETSRRRMLSGLLACHQLPPTLLSLRLLTSAANCQMMVGDGSESTMPPPLPKGHPSPALLAKLYLEIPRITDEAHRELQAASGGSSVTAKSSKSIFNIRGNRAATSFPSQSSKATSATSLSSRLKGLRVGSSGDDLQRSASPEDNGLSPVDDDDSDVAGDGGFGYERRGLGGIPSPRIQQGSIDAVGGKSCSMSGATSSHVLLSKRLLRYLSVTSAWAQSSAFLYQALGVAEGSDAGGGGGGGASRHAEAIVWLQLASLKLLEPSFSTDERGNKKAWADFTGNANWYDSMTKQLDPKAQAKEEKEGGKRVGGLRGRFQSARSASPASANAGAMLDGSSLDAQPPSSSAQPSSGSHPLQHRLQAYHLTQTSRQLVPLLIHLSRVYTQINNSVSFQPLPYKEDLLGHKVPGPRGIIDFDASSSGGSGWSLPKAEFGSAAKGGGGGVQFGKWGFDVTASSAVDGDVDSGGKPGEYAGQGAYY
ncbi:unnamed protein product [Jaminaea pallidilutea]